MPDMIPASRVVSVVNARVSEAFASLREADIPSYSREAVDAAVKALGVALELLALVNVPTEAPASCGDLTDARKKGTRLPEVETPDVRPTPGPIVEAAPVIHTLTSSLEPLPMDGPDI